MGNLPICCIEEVEDDLSSNRLMVNSKLQKDKKKQDIAEQSTSSRTDSHLTIHYKQVSLIESDLIYLQKNGSELRSSMCLTLSTHCSECYNEIEQGCIITSCGHNYHKKCLNSLLWSQVSLAYPIPRCGYCRTKFHFRLLDALGDKILQETYLKLQVAQIKKNYPMIRKCKTAECDFIYYQVGNSPSYCPNCMY